MPIFSAPGIEYEHFLSIFLRQEALKLKWFQGFELATKLVIPNLFTQKNSLQDQKCHWNSAELF